MPQRPKLHTPSYRHHKARGLAVVTIDGHDYYLGPFGSQESHEAYDRLIAEWLANGRRMPTKADEDASKGPTVNEIILAFMRHACQHYRRVDGTHTTEVREFGRAFGPLRRLYGCTPAQEFGPLALKTVREEYVATGLCRGVVNQRSNRIRRLFKWATSEELVPPSVFQGLQTVQGLQMGRCEARERDPIKPVAVEVVEQTLTHANRFISAMVRVQLLTGARPGEVCAMRAADIEMSGAIWQYRPVQHKTRHHGRSRVIAIGPRAQEILRPFLPTDPQAHIFSPALAEQERRAEKSTTRKTPKSCGNLPGTNRRAKPRKNPGTRYTTSSYSKAIASTCRKAFPAPMGLDSEAEKAWHRNHSWHPNQLRHTRATDIRRHYGLEAAQVILGHSKADVTQVYAERDLDLAEKVAQEIG